MTKILGLGHSHVVAIAKGCYALQDEQFKVADAPLRSRFIYLYEPTLLPTLFDESEPPSLNPALCKIIEDENPDFLVLSVGGNEHIALSVAQKGDRIDFILGAEPGLP
ncbi:MAG: hypothetical protein N2444_09180, partial [Methylocystis sp.]|nr:hypothetical protein [Methylocystis sp.]